MIMRVTTILALSLALAACTEVVSEQDTTFTYRGDVYRAVIRDYDANGRTFTKRVVYDGNRAVSCSATDDLDCAAAISYERLDSND
ncbi:hypothetical protein [Tateyamaria omphalii]|uniref:Lipoprotein n=1 Tax=Tateyamaria omphalii TaxID=299262 RepID=A0A1P8MS46_9RHOB|nr:hypothetical protein [Tateyamaria omphalii]APX10789.1 hypothetical protein BWR18_03085 [Tateyamaria omphalii]